MKCPRCRGYAFATEDGWGTALRCVHCGWEREIACRMAAADRATPRAADGGAPPLWETYCTTFPWEDWVRLALSGKARERGAYGKGRFRLRGLGRERG